MISNTTFVIQYNLLSNGWLKTLYFIAFMAAVEKLQPTGIVLSGCCTDTQSNSFIHFSKIWTVSSCIVSISNQCASSQSSALPSRSSLIFVSRFGLFDVGLCSFSQ